VIAENVDDAVLRRAEHDGTLALHAGDPPHGRPVATATSGRPPFGQAFVRACLSPSRGRPRYFVP
jgi:hypothetical protein